MSKQFSHSVGSHERRLTTTCTDTFRSPPPPPASIETRYSTAGDGRKRHPSRPPFPSNKFSDSLRRCAGGGATRGYVRSPRRLFEFTLAKSNDVLLQSSRWDASLLSSDVSMGSEVFKCIFVPAGVWRDLPGVCGGVQEHHRQSESERQRQKPTPLRHLLRLENTRQKHTLAV